MAQGRSLYREVIKNFINSLKPKNIWGDFRGRDSYGTEYYEASEGSGHKSKRSRWFVPKVKDNFEQEMPPEWTAWLTYKRKEPPTEEEIQMNVLKMKQTIEKAKKLEPPRKQNKEEIKSFEKPAFPVYEDYNEKEGFK